MTRLLAGALALAAWAAPVIVQDTQPSGDADMDQLQVRITEMTDGLRTRMDRLKALQETYADESRVPEVEAERKALVSGLKRDLHLLDSLEMAYSSAFLTQDRVLKARTFSLISKGQGIPAGAVKAVTASYGRTEFMDQSRAFRHKALSELAAEEVSFGVARDAWDNRRLLTRFTAAGLLLVAVLVAASLLNRRRAAALLFTLLLPGASSAAGPKDPALDQATDEMSRLMDETAPLAQRLELLIGACQEPSTFEACSEERTALRKGIETRLKRLHELQGVTDGVYERTGWNALFIAVSEAKRSRTIPAEAGAEFVKHRSLREFNKGASEYRKKTQDLLERESAAYLEAWKLAESRRRLRALAWGIPFLLLLGAGAWRLAPRLLRPRKAPASGDVLGRRWRVARALGSGTFGALFEAEDLESHAKAALRVYEGPRAKALGPHPGILAPKASFKHGGAACQVFEPCAGRPLSDWLEGGKRLPLVSVKRVARQAADALAFAHAKGVVHGGLKPSKVLLAPDLALKLRDFGRARPDSIHAAPEVVRGGTALPASDVFALGALLYHALAGRPPYETTSLELRAKSLFVPPAELAEGLPTEADELFRRALAPDPARRFATPAELAAAVENLPE